jgi:4-amino-4-deoxy-L-arabinose transferase-like glycosyltransferase
MSHIESRKLIVGLIIFVISLGVRLIYVNTTVIDTPIRADAAKYYTLANNLLNHGVYSSNKGSELTPETAITPGYPLFIASLMSIHPDNPRVSYLLILNVQAVLGAITVLIMYIIGLLFLPAWAAIAAGLLAALSPHLIVMCGYVLTETLFTFLFTLAIYIVMRACTNNMPALFLVFGLLSGCAALVRPALVLFPFFVAIGFLITPQLSKAGRKAASFIIPGFLVIWLPWAYWEYQAAADVAPKYSSMAASLALGIYPDLIYKNPQLRGFPYAEDPTYTEMSKNVWNALGVLKHRAGEEPAKYLYWYLLGKPYTYWSWDTIVGQGGPFIFPVISSMYHRNKIAFASLQLSRAMHPFLLLAAGFSCIYILIKYISGKNISENIFVITLIASTLLYFTAVHTVLAPLPRYAVPVYPMLYLLAMFGIWKAGVLLHTQYSKGNTIHES